MHLSNLSVRFMRTVRYKRYDGSATAQEHQTQQNHLDALEQWKTTFSYLQATKEPSTKDLEAAKLLEIHRIVGLAWLRSCLAPEETATDRDIPSFSAALNLAEELQQSQQAAAASNTLQPGQDSFNSTFFFDMEVVAPLYMIATKCRHALLRRRAIALLRSITRREGLWDSQEAAAVAERVMAHEEAELTTLDGSELPAEALRVHTTHIENSPVLNFSLHDLTFYSRRDGNWRIWREQLLLQTVNGENVMNAAADNDDGSAMSLHWKFPLGQVRPVDAVVGHGCEIAGDGFAQA